MYDVGTDILEHGTRRSGQGYTIGTGQILESYYDENRPEPMPMSKPGKIIEFKPNISGQEVNNILKSKEIDNNIL